MDAYFPSESTNTMSVNSLDLAGMHSTVKKSREKSEVKIECESGS